MVGFTPKSSAFDIASVRKLPFPELARRERNAGADAERRPFKPSTVGRTYRIATPVKSRSKRSNKGFTDDRRSDEQNYMKHENLEFFEKSAGFLRDNM